MSTLRRLVAAATPATLKRRHERWSTDRYLARLRPANEEYVRRHGLEVQHGPFAGLRYLDGLEATSGDLVAKLTGRYEHELLPVWEHWRAAGIDRVVDVGSAEGFYAVGFAHAWPDVTVDAHDIDPVARERCARLAAINGVQDRVHVRGECTPETLAGLPAGGVALLSDCEGYERVLLDPERAPVLRGWHVLVELHEFLDPEVTEVLRARFADSHQVELIEERAPDLELEELAFLDPGTRALVLSERRPAQMRWMWLRPA